MNNTNLTGRLTRDPEVRYTDGGSTIARFTLAVDRRFKTENGPQADFIGCVAFGKTAEFIEKWFSKGVKMELTGRIQTGSYTNQDGQKIYTTDIVAEQVGFAESKSASQGNNHEYRQNEDQGFGPPDRDGFMNIPEDIDEELPFN